MGTFVSRIRLSPTPQLTSAFRECKLVSPFETPTTRRISPVPQMSVPSLPELEIDSSGCCWTCVHLGDACDSTLLPTGCRTCAERQRVCEGFHARLSWPRFYDSARKKPDPFAIRLPAHGLPAKEGRLIQHFVHNIARLALSIDYEDNGYRRLVSIALNEASLLYALLAMSASHLSRWHRLPDTTSRIYLRSAFEQLEQRFASPSKMREEATLATMLVLLGYEVPHELYFNVTHNALT